MAEVVEVDMVEVDGLGAVADDFGYGCLDKGKRKLVEHL